MGKQIENEVEYYYDSHPTKEDLMGETSFHADLVRYLMLVLQWFLRDQICALYENLNFYQTRNPKEYPLAPDIALIKGVPFHHLRSWKIGRTGPAPHVVFEIASDETWKKDVREKPIKYAQMGVDEYFFYDADDPPNVKDPRHRLLGWRLDKSTGTMVAMLPDEQGRLWSTHLESYLVPDGLRLRLYDSENHLRLTEADAQAQERIALAQKAEALMQKLRSLGVNPDEL